MRTAGAGRYALERSFEEMFGVAHSLRGVRLDGNTDPSIYEVMFQTRLGRPPAPDEVQQLQVRYLAHLEVSLVDRADGYQVLPGVEAILKEAVRRAYSLGLCTGNIEAGARMKLRPGRLDAFFPFGGFGSDHGDRAVLVQRALERAGRHAGRTVSPEEAVLFGDTERDVDAARRAGARSVGVCAGCTDRDTLAAAQPDFLAESLDDPGLWRWLGWTL